MKHVLLIAVLLSGCAGPTYWVKPGGTEAEFNRTMARCRMQATGIQPSKTRRMNTPGAIISSAGDDLQDAATLSQFMDDCLMSEGWTQRQ